MTITGGPAVIRPSGDAGLNTIIPCIVRDSAGEYVGKVQIGTNGTLTFFIGSPLASTNFTASGTKGIPAGWSVTFNCGN
jgi:hypothetical protein